jgi:hypothetical protein
VAARVLLVVPVALVREGGAKGSSTTLSTSSSGREIAIVTRCVMWAYSSPYDVLFCHYTPSFSLSHTSLITTQLQLTQQSSLSSSLSPPQPPPTHPEHSDSQASIEEYPEALRKEISDLQQALVDKFGGSSKRVSGAQFRNSSGPAMHKCETCESKDLRYVIHCKLASAVTLLS